MAIFAELELEIVAYSDPNKVEVSTTITAFETAFAQVGGPVSVGDTIYGVDDFGGTLDTRTNLNIIDVGDWVLSLTDPVEDQPETADSVGDYVSVQNSIAISDTISVGDTVSSKDFAVVVSGGSTRIIATDRYRR